MNSATGASHMRLAPKRSLSQPDIGITIDPDSR